MPMTIAPKTVICAHFVYCWLFVDDAEQKIKVLVFPVSIIWRIHIAPRQKVALGCSLCLTVFVMAATATRAAGLRRQGTIDITWDVYWNAVAAMTALIVNSATALRVLFVARSGGKPRPRQQQQQPQPQQHRANRHDPEAVNGDGDGDGDASGDSGCAKGAAKVAGGAGQSAAGKGGWASRVLVSLRSSTERMASGRRLSTTTSASSHEGSETAGVSRFDGDNDTTLQRSSRANGRRWRMGLSGWLLPKDTVPHGTLTGMRTFISEVVADDGRADGSVDATTAKGAP
jgi:hypothetical protein